MGTSPAALWPNRKFSPTTTAAAWSRSDRTTRTNSSGLSREKSRLNGSTKTASAPRPARSSERRRAVVSSGGCEPGLITSSGWGSKVIVTTGSDRDWAISRARSTTRWWPRCTPSNSPIVATHAPQSEGTSARPYQRYTISVPPLVSLAPSDETYTSKPRASGKDDERPGLSGLLSDQGDQGAVGRVG